MSEKTDFYGYCLAFIIGIIFTIIVVGMIRDYQEKHTECYKYGYEPTICTVYKNHYPENCDMVYKLDVKEPCAVTVCAVGYECEPSVICNEYYMCCNFEEVCLAIKK